MQHIMTQATHNVCFDSTVLQCTAVHDLCSDKNTCGSGKVTHVHAGGALGGDVLHAAEPWGLGLPWGDANVTGAPI